MTIYPAIDLKEGKCVRLLQGNFDKKTVYADNPASVAKQFVDDGAKFIHIVDLDAARTGIAVNNSIIQEIIQNYGVKVQTGGGIRELKDVEQRLDIGVSRVIIGTAAIKNPTMLREAVYHFGDKVAVGIDAKNGMVAVSGWEELSVETVNDMALRMKDIGVKHIIYTNIETDGMMSGTDIEGLKNLIELTDLNIIASGGVSSIDDLNEVAHSGAEGVIIGQALYKGVLDLKMVINKFRR